MTDATSSTVVTFTPSSTLQTDPVHPTTASNHTPTWLSNLTADSESLTSFRNSTVKLCMPFTDAVSIGWVVKSPVTVTLTQDGETGEFNITRENNDSSRNGTAETTAVTTLTDSTQTSEQNSSFATPNYLLNTGWKVDTPPGTSLLFTPPMNRVEPRFTSGGLLVDTDTYDGDIVIPLVLNGDETTIKRGDVLAQVIPISREARLSTPDLCSIEPGSPAAELKTHISETVSSRSGFYRRDVWVKKPGFRVITDTDKLDTSAPVREGNVPESSSPRAFIGEGSDQAFYCEDALKGEIPEPKPAGEFIPDNHFKLMEETTQINTEQPITKWMKAAMDLGTIFPLPNDVHLTRDETGTVNASSHNPNIFHELHPAKIGDDHPFAPLNPVNLIGQWAPVLKHGYSNMYIRPLNHFQQYYQSFSGIVESDRYFSTVNIPGILSPHRSELTLPQGMPVTQGIPLHRQSLISTLYIND